ncbi:DUF7674 family protein [Micromonospora sp. CPCC 205556]|uniref:DUF7674 family protein n=1 Tax=Micromonospora sp. CPCC 205556 TaxID=3122398 RepID=UPI002FF05CF9
MATADLTYGGVVPALIEVVPELRDALNEHIRDNDEILQHVFFGCDVVPFVLDAWKHGRAGVLARCLGFLDAAMASPSTRELVAVSFVEAVGPWDSTMADFIAIWPQALAEEAAAQVG